MQKFACPPTRFELLPTGQNLTPKSEVAPNKNSPSFERGTASDIFFYRGQKLELRLWKSGFLSWVPLGETAILVLSSVRLFSSVYRSKTNMNAKKKSHSTRIKSDPRRKRPD